ncbi:fbox domain containing protein [Stylonychia lemnae]|uniref:Fbox domain containing protein n=1 Tax=Stylonychia lemnae TaxID=5949 RepID=A0A078BAP4_STYLE|nr:fbox domain containing protein [Stylonychia lemnae]|eukprot:CDW90322.1 fbox domain containing protein [Stylonychia lemnae]
MEKIFDFGVDLLLPMFSSTILKSIDIVQAQQQPPYSDGLYYMEISKESKNHTGILFKKIFNLMIDPVFTNLFRSNAFYSNPDCSKFSMTQIDQSYKKYSEQIEAIYPGYFIDDNFLVVNKNDLQIDLNSLRDFFLSTDLVNYETLKANFIGTQTRFLMPTKELGVTYTSFPRSGNTFLRKYFETITGIATGSDMVMKFSLNVALQYAGFKGEGIVDNRVWINKTHFPYRLPYDHSYETGIILCCVRNPLDVFVSQLLQICTMCHNQDINEDFTQYPEWALHVNQEVMIWKKWHQYWIDMAQKQEVPILFFRFEDLLLDAQSTLSEIFSFALRVKDIKGTFIEQRIIEVINSGSKGNTLYKPRQGGINKNKDKYTESQMKYIMDNLEDLLNFFGYTDHQGVKNDFEFFTYGENASQESSDKFEGFRKLNEQTWNYLMNNPEKAASSKMTINQGKEGFSMIKEKNIFQFFPVFEKSSIRKAQTNKKIYDPQQSQKQSNHQQNIKNQNQCQHESDMKQQ